MPRLLARPALLVTLAAGGLLAGCGEEIGSVEAEAEERRAVSLDGRQLILDGFAGTVSVEADASLDEAELVFTRVAGGATEESAQGLLPRVRLEEAGDGELYQFVWRTDLPRGARVDADVRVPLGTDLVVRLGAGDLRLAGLDGPVDAETGAGNVTVEMGSSTTLRTKTGSGATRLEAVALPLDAAWRAEAGAGDLTIALSPGVSVRVDAESGAGTLTLDEALDFADPVAGDTPGRASFSGTLRDGTASLDATTGAGNLTVRALTTAADTTDAP